MKINLLSKALLTGILSMIIISIVCFFLAGFSGESSLVIGSISYYGASIQFMVSERKWK